MATPVGDSYTCASGGAIAAGRYMPPTQRTVIVGDSLSAWLPLPFAWGNGAGGGLLNIVANIAAPSDTVAMVLARIDNDHTAPSPGMAGLSDIGFSVIRVGTNDARGGAAISAQNIADYRTLFSKLLGYSRYVIVQAVPPAFQSGNANEIDTFNSFLQGECAGNSRLLWVDDCATVRDIDGNWASAAYAADDVHYNEIAGMAMGLQQASILPALLSGLSLGASPVSSAPPSYPADQQWISNPLNAGSGGTNGIGSGLVPNGWSISQYGTPFTVNSSIVAADGGDANQTPWLRISPTQIQSSGGAGFYLTSTTAHDAVTTIYPTQVEVVVELRFNAFDATKFKELRWELYGNNNEQLAPSVTLPMGYSAVTNQIVWRGSVPRLMASAAAHSSAVFNLFFQGREAFSGSMGSVDIRCVSVRG